MNRLLAGRIGKPHGTGGEVYVVRISDDPERFQPGSRLGHEDGRTLVVESSRPHRDRFLVKFEGIEDRSSAEGIRGELYVSTDSARALQRGEYWIDDLVGCSVLVDGNEIGTVTSVVSNPSQDLLVVDVGDGEALVPVVEAIVVEVDLETRTVTVDPPDGLLDL